MGPNQPTNYRRVLWLIRTDISECTVDSEWHRSEDRSSKKVVAVNKSRGFPG